MCVYLIVDIAGMVHNVCATQSLADAWLAFEVSRQNGYTEKLFVREHYVYDTLPPTK